MKRRVPASRRRTFVEADADLRHLWSSPWKKTIPNAGDITLQTPDTFNFTFFQPPVPPFLIGTGSQKTIQSP